jgi:hypothetical protein
VVEVLDAYAHLLAARGASVVVNDLVAPGENTAVEVAREITDAGGSAAASTDSVATESGANTIVAAASDHRSDDGRVAR